MKNTDIRPVGVEVHFLPIETRMPLKFGPETLTHVTCLRVRMRVSDKDGRSADGWGETPLSIQWLWPSSLPYEERHDALKKFSLSLGEIWAGFEKTGHPLEVGSAFIKDELPKALEKLNNERVGTEPMPWLAALVCCSAYDIALHDAYGQLHDVFIYDTYTSDYITRDLASFLTPEEESDVSFDGKFPSDFLSTNPPKMMPAWHLVGGKDPLAEEELTGDEPDDGYPVLLADWIESDELQCLKVKLRGDDAVWDYERLVNVGEMAIAKEALCLTADFNCTVSDPEYVNMILDQLLSRHPRIHQMIMYVEQPFPYDLEKNKIDVHSVSARKPLLMDESAHDWHLVKLGRRLGWTGVALKTCKTQTGAILMLCWAKAHGMTLMVQDLTNPMLAQIPHVLLAAYAETIMGVETNSMQFYPQASEAEAAVHPGIYRREHGSVDLSTVSGPGFGYKIEEIKRDLPEPVLSVGDIG